jgi:threonine aldolase
VKPRGHLIFPPTTLVEVENTQNRAGGVVWDPEALAQVAAAARERGISSYLDGARLLNAAVARGDDPAALAAPFDLVTIALSKGLGAPAGSVLAGSARDIGALVRFRRMLGGAMRQSGILAAAGSYALEHNVARLADDHANARIIGERLAVVPGVRIDLGRLETNIVVFHLEAGAPDAAEVVRRAGEQGVLVLAFADRTVRAVTHLDVSAEACRRGAEALARAVEGENA